MPASPSSARAWVECRVAYFVQTYLTVTYIFSLMLAGTVTSLYTVRHCKLFLCLTFHKPFYSILSQIWIVLVYLQLSASKYLKHIAHWAGVLVCFALTPKVRVTKTCLLPNSNALLVANTNVQTSDFNVVDKYSIPWVVMYGVRVTTAHNTCMNARDNHVLYCTVRRDRIVHSSCITSNNCYWPMQTAAANTN